MTDILPPHSSPAECAIIGCCLNRPVESIPQVQAVLSLEAFYELRHREILDAAFSMSPDRVDLITVSQILTDRGIFENLGGHEYLAKCQDDGFSSANLSEWIRIVQDKFTLRKIIAMCSSLTADAYGATDASELLDRLETSSLSIRPQNRPSSDIRSLTNEAINQIEKKFYTKDGIGGLTTGLIDLDRLTDGLHDGEMIVLSGFPSTGKTALSVNMAVTLALAGIPTAVFSAEMRPAQLMVRSICSESRANYHHLEEKDLAKMVNVSRNLAKSPLCMEAAHGMTISQLCATARRLKQQKGIRMMVVDYIQLLQGTGDNREQQISSVSKGLKSIALELNLPVIALSQLNDDGKLRESRSIGQDADSVWKLENDGERQPRIQPIKLHVEKCRDGETGTVSMTFFKEFTRFADVAKIDERDVPHYNPGE